MAPASTAMAVLIRPSYCSLNRFLISAAETASNVSLANLGIRIAGRDSLGRRYSKSAAGGAPAARKIIGIVSWTVSNPRAVGVAAAVGPAVGVALDAEGLQFIRQRAAGEVPRAELADADHLEAVVGVRDHPGIRRDPVEHRHVVRRKGADAAVAPLLEQLARALEAAEQVGERGAVVVREPVVGLVLVVQVAVRLDIRLAADLDR